MAATYAELGDSQAKPNCESRLAAASDMSGATEQVVWSWGLTEVGCFLFDRIQEVVNHEPRSAIHVEKSVNSLGCPVSWVLQVLVDLQSRAHSVSQVNGVSDMASACRLCGFVALWQGASEKGQWPFCLRKSCPPVLTLMPGPSVPPCIPLVCFKLLPQC